MVEKVSSDPTFMDFKCFMSPGRLLQDIDRLHMTLAFPLLTLFRMGNLAGQKF